ncbi:MBOAT family protein [Flavobacteriales bacterium]|nr:MBOAT family protein [Flavobacteriales bacterium]
MLFNSPEFLLFLPIVFGLYWFVVQKNLKAQNILILAASYFFYGWWDWRFLGLIALSTVVDYTVGLQIDKHTEEKKRKLWLWVSLLVNLGLLGYFKYTNFFIESWVDAWSALGVKMHTSTLQIILPIGISFYTFQTMSYALDIYRGQLKPTRNFLNFAAFVSFFPQLVAGPIERASRLLPQIESRRVFKYEEGVAGLRLILWGMFKKVVVADTCAIYVNDIFANYTEYSGPTLILGMVYFAFQIYGDFSGYSDIAIGTAKLFGIQLMTNFKTPFFSKSIPEFWNRWHISLNTWMNDYVFFPMAFAFRQRGKWGVGLAVMLTFLISGFWHGSEWKFVIWGGIHGLAFLPYIAMSKGPVRLFESHKEKHGSTSILNLKSFILMLIPFAVNLFAWVFFRADSVGEAVEYLGQMGTNVISWPEGNKIAGLASIIVLLTIEGLNHSKNAMHLWFSQSFVIIRWVLSALIILIIIKGFASQADFIYFQF